MKIAIIGAGALGIMFSSFLAQDKSNEIVLLEVVDDAIKKLNNEGVICYDQDKTLTAKIKSYKSGTLNDKFDLVIILTKTNYSKVSLDSNLGLFDKHTYLLTVQNGLGNKEKLSNYVDEDHLLIAVTKNNAVKLDYNIARRSNHNMTTIGYNSNNKEFVTKLADMLQSNGFDCRLSDNIDALVWEKAFLNLSVNAYCAYYNKSIKDMVNDDSIWSLAKKTIYEALTVANKLGQHFDYQDITDHIFNDMKNLNGYPSMWQDVTAKRVTEIMALNGRVSELGDELGIDVSENKRITKCIQDLEKSFRK